MEYDKLLYIIRHGQTEFNKMGYVQGSGINAGLNEMGQFQAASFFEHYKNEGFDKVYYSGLKRTRESVSQFIDAGLPHQGLKDLNEICWGESEGKKPSPEQNKQFFATLEAWRRGYTTISMPDGESPEEVLDRMKSAVAFIMQQTAEKKVLICSHGRAMRVLLCHLAGLSLRQMDDFEHRNLCLYKVGYTSTKGFEILVRNEIVY